MGISGNLKTMEFSELLQWCKNGQKMGTLTLSREGIVKNIYFEAGRIISAGSNDPREYLGQFFVNQGLISEVQLKEAFETQKQTGVLLGKILVMTGLVEEKQLEETLRVKIMETIFDIFLWREGVFHFHDEQLSYSGLHIQIEMDVDSCVFEGARRYDEYMRCRKLLPHNGIRFKRTELVPSDLEKKPRLKRLLELLGTGRSVGELCLEFHSNEYKILVKLQELLTKRLIAIDEKSLQALAPEESEKSSATRYPSEKEELDSLYRDFLPPDRVPQLLSGLDSLESYRLSSEEAYIISRINGEWDISSIVMISPIKEIGTLRILKRFLDEKIIILA